MNWNISFARGNLNSANSFVRSCVCDYQSIKGSGQVQGGQGQCSLCLSALQPGTGEYLPGGTVT